MQKLLRELRELREIDTETLRELDLLSYCTVPELREIDTEALWELDLLSYSPRTKRNRYRSSEGT